MDSHEEKLHKMIIASKIQETKDAMKKRAHEIERLKIEKKAQMTAVSSGGGGMEMRG